MAGMYNGMIASAVAFAIGFVLFCKADKLNKARQAAKQ